MLTASALVCLAILVWIVFLAPMSPRESVGRITSKIHRQPSVYTQQPVEVNRGFRQPRDIPIAESYTFELEVEGIAKPVRTSFNVVKSRQFEVGQRVRVQYVRRGLPALWQRTLILDMTPLDQP